jgi:hypothetical protein
MPEPAIAAIPAIATIKDWHQPIFPPGSPLPPASRKPDQNHGPHRPMAAPRRWPGHPNGMTLP